jgi:hypothetical protein
VATANPPWAEVEVLVAGVATEVLVAGVATEVLVAGVAAEAAS